MSAIAGTFASLPFTLAVDGGLSLGALLSQASILVSCSLFGVTYRYAVRRDLGNLQLKSGVAAAFGLVRGENGLHVIFVLLFVCRLILFIMSAAQVLGMLHKLWLIFPKGALTVSSRQA